MCVCVLQVMEELVPKETGRDARISKRKALNEQRRERQASPEHDESDALGTDVSNFQSYMQRRKASMAVQR